MNRLKNHRKNIANIDLQIIHLLKHRMNEVEKIAHIKKELNLAIKNLDIEHQFKKKYLKISKKLSLPSIFVLEIFLLIVKYSCIMQENIYKNYND